MCSLVFSNLVRPSPRKATNWWQRWDRLSYHPIVLFLGMLGRTKIKTNHMPLLINTRSHHPGRPGPISYLDDFYSTIVLSFLRMEKPVARDDLDYFRTTVILEAATTFFFSFWRPTFHLPTSECKNNRKFPTIFICFFSLGWGSSWSCSYCHP